MVDSDDVKVTPVMHYNSEANAINLPVTVGCLSCIPLPTKPDRAPVEQQE